MDKPVERNNDVSLSPLQNDILLAMPFGMEISSTELIDTIYAGKERPFDPRGQLFSGMNVLIRKLDHANHKWRIVKSARKGSKPITFKLEKRR